MIRESISKIAGLYAGHERDWLAKNNPAALKTMDAMCDDIDRAELAGDKEGVKRACARWVNTWLFWVGAIKRNG